MDDFSFNSLETEDEKALLQEERFYSIELYSKLIYFSRMNPKATEYYYQIEFFGRFKTIRSLIIK